MSPLPRPDRSRWALLGIAGVALLTSGCGSARPSEAEALRDVLVLEDARPLDSVGIQALIARARAPDVTTRRFAVRALGRMEDPTLLDRIVPLLADEAPEVRATAAWAAAQAVHGGEGTPAVAPLLAAARTESDPEARGELARSLGRVRPEGRDAVAVVDVLHAWASDSALPAATALGVALGLEALTRATGPAASDDRVYEALSSLAARPAAPDADPVTAPRLRTVSLLGLGQRGRITAAQVAAALEDTSPTVRAIGARFLAAVSDPAAREALTREAIEDEATIVRVEALRVLANADRTPERCALLSRAARTTDPTPARLVAIDALAMPCPGSEGTAARSHLDSLARALPDAPDSSWRPAAHALGALARLAPDLARAALPRHVDHPYPFVRVQAAATAAVLQDTTTLRALAADADPNVRTAALGPLFDLEGRRLDARLVEALSSDDGQLLLTVAALLEGTDRVDAAAAALGAFERISEARRETARDPRLALLDLLADVGRSELASRLEPYLTDYDQLVAARVAEILSDWTGSTRAPAPEPLPRLELPTVAELETTSRVRVILHMAGGGEIVIEPLPFLAPTNAHRFVRLAREGWFDGLTFHRVVPNFVIQGGSPSANEYAGDGPYTRDEIGRISHWRGTVGLSTRGRDTGDGQIFVNLVDNVRLDHDYTVFGTVVSGMETVDSVLAGDVIERVEIRPQD